MKSRITIDLDNDNQPIIKVDYVPSDDVRDKMIARFSQTFGHESNWATVTFIPSTDGTKTLTIRPIPSDEIFNVSDEMTARLIKGK